MNDRAIKIKEINFSELFDLNDSELKKIVYRSSPVINNRPEKIFLYGFTNDIGL